jgi:hypothetical protein
MLGAPLGVAADAVAARGGFSGGVDPRSRLLLSRAPANHCSESALGGFQTVAAEARRYAFPHGPLRHAPVHLRRSRRGVNSCATDEPRTTSRVSAELSPAAVRNAVLGMRGRCAGSRATSRSAASATTRRPTSLLRPEGRVVAVGRSRQNSDRRRQPPYRGRLIVECVPARSTSELTLSDTPVVRSANLNTLVSARTAAFERNLLEGSLLTLDGQPPTRRLDRREVPLRTPPGTALIAPFHRLISLMF